MLIHRNLRDLLACLRRERELVEVECEVDPRLEIAEIHRRVVAAGGPALLFRHAKGSRIPVVTNLFGSRKRIELAFGDRPGRFLRELAGLARTLLPPTFAKLWRARGLIVQAARVGLVRRRRGPVTEHRVAAPALDRLPLLTTWPEDGGPFVTLPLVLTADPSTGHQNLGVYRMHRYDAATTAMHWQIGKGGGFHHHAAEALGRSLPVNVFLGGPPALILAAIAPLPEEVPELILASLVLGERMPVVENPDGPLPLVAEAEFALVGDVPSGERRPEGPFGDHYGYYSLVHDYPVFRCRALYHRDDPIYPATVVGKPRQEDFFLGDYLQELLAPLFPLVMPAVIDLWSYGETGYHSLAAAVVRERYGREAMASAFRILGEGQLSLTKFLIVLDRPRDLRDFRGVLTHVLERVDWSRDLYVFDHLSMDTLDYTGREVNKGSKGVVLGLGEPVRELPAALAGPPPAGARRVLPFVPGCLVLEGASYADDPELGARLARDPAVAAWPLLVLVDDAARATASTPRFLWTTFTRFEPAGDIHAASTAARRHHLGYGGPVLIDARLKPWFPRELFCDEDTARTVTRRWSEYFAGGRVQMGSSDTAHLDREA
jgi:UbiD family decarboxylase